MGQSSIDTDDLGQYRVADLSPGKYYVRPPKDPSPPRMVEVAVGDRIAGIDFTLIQTRTVRVTGHVDFPAGTRLSRLKMTTGRADESFEIQGRTEANGDFEFDAVPPGSYTLTAVASPPKKPASDIMEFQFQGGFDAQTPVQVADMPVKNVRLQVLPGAEVTGPVFGPDEI